MSGYPAGLTLRPITNWPGAYTRNRRRSNFSAPWRSTLNLLDRELHYLGTGNRNAPAVMQIAMREQDFRLDGLPRANAKPEHPGIILSVESSKGPLSFPSDRFTTWQDNLRAIALSLEALRKVDRYGVTRNAEQYTGWKAIGTGGGDAIVQPVFASADAAERFLRELAPIPVGGSTLNTVQSVYRRAAAVAHPDRRDGDRTLWDKVEAAAELLRADGRLA
ncbi:molecular chaperone DnaJ [Rhodococcoides corynebacterioides]|uniref:molecular chaperone DnaJ n=1 Tax=Rhodococcoides corynebacterioides TaxID=53972 RepID=UPI003F7D0450